MKPVKRSNLIELAAEALLHGIRDGSWKGRLPGCRILAKTLGVSPPTMSKALHLLLAEGILCHEGARRAYRIIPNPERDPGASSIRRLLILTPEDPQIGIESNRRILDGLRIRMLNKGWEVDSQVIDFVNVQNPQQSWDRVIETHPQTSIIALHGRPALAQWAVRKDIPTLFLGGISGGWPVSMIGIRSSDLLDQALSRLIRLGHRKIVIPLFNRAENFKATMREMTRKHVESCGLTYVPAYHTPESNYGDPEAVLQMIRAVFHKDPPSALVVLDWGHALTARGVLAELNLKVPDDVSLVMLSDDANARWLPPQVARFRFPEARFINSMTAWLEGRLPIRAGGTVFLKARFIEGQTLAPAKSI